MAHGGKLQGWVTIRGPDSGTIVQDEDEWLDLWDYDDVVIWCQITDQSNVEELDIQTSPVKQEEMFLTMATLTLTVTTGPLITVLAFASASTPLARYVRWKCVGRNGSAFSITFRTWVVASGRQVPPVALMLAPSRRGYQVEETEDTWPPEDEQPEGGTDLDEQANMAAGSARTEDTPGAGDEQAWKTWRPPILFVGPRASRIRGMGRPAADLADAIVTRQAPAGAERAPGAEDGGLEDGVQPGSVAFSGPS